MSVQNVPTSNVNSTDRSYYAQFVKKVSDPKFPDTIAVQQTARKVACIVGMVLCGALLLGGLVAYWVGLSPVGLGVWIGTMPLWGVGLLTFLSSAFAGAFVGMVDACTSDVYSLRMGLFQKILYPTRAENYREIQRQYKAMEDASGASLGHFAFGERLQQLKPLIAARQFWSEKLDALSKDLRIAQQERKGTSMTERAMFEAKFKVALLDALMEQSDLKKWTAEDVRAVKASFQRTFTEKVMRESSIAALSKQIAREIENWHQPPPSQKWVIN